MSSNLTIRLVVALNLATAIGAQEFHKNHPSTPPQVFIHSRGESTGRPFLETWQEDGVIHFLESESGRAYAFQYETLVETLSRPPTLAAGWRGLIKQRKGQWWFLRFERGHLPEDRLSELHHYDPVSKAWTLQHRLEVRASNFEVLDEGGILLFGVLEPVKNRYYLAGTLSGGSSTVSLLDEAPIKKRFPEQFWKACITSVDSQMAYAYFPMSGHFIGYNQDSHSLKKFRVPWPLISDESMDKEIEAAATSGKPNCFISAVGHPSPNNCYLLPIPGGQMGFIYKVLDEEEEKRLAFADGTRPVIEKSAAFMVVPDDPNMLIELTTPNQKSLERLVWSQTANRLVRWGQLKASEKKPLLKPPRIPPAIKPDLLAKP
jgi:hypothetical protein